MGTKGLESKSRVGESGAANELGETEAVVLLASGDYDRGVETLALSLDGMGSGPVGQSLDSLASYMDKATSTSAIRPSLTASSPFFRAGTNSAGSSTLTPYPPNGSISLG